MKENDVTSRSVVIPNGVDCKRFSFDEDKRNAFRAKYDLRDEWVVFSVGLLIPRKGVADFIQVARAFEDEARFIWVGSTEKMLKKMDVSQVSRNVDFIGYVPFEEMPTVYAGGDIFFFPTYAESYGNVLFEAAAAGRALVIRDIKTYQGLLEDGVHCAKGKTVTEYTQHIQEIIRDRDLQDTLREGALKLAAEQDLHITIEKLIETYEELLQC
jgi:glycosyltransferase involved in cell wall biosynthesis